jgi:hypothetical protein
MGIRRDQRGIIASWLVRLTIGFVIAGVVIYDAGSMLVNFFTLDTTAEDIAIEISTEVISSSRPALQERELKLRAKELAKESSARLRDFSVDDQGVVFVQLRRRADTLVVGRIGPIKDWARATADGQAGS